MNLAFSAVLIFILLLPPIAFYVSYNLGIQAKAGPRFSFLDGALASAVFSLFIHALAITVIGKEIRFDILLKLFGGELKDLENKISNGVFTSSLKQFAIYNLAIFLICVFLGRTVRYFVVRFDLHGNELSRLYNKWWYLFNGYYLDTLDKPRDYDVVFVDAVVDCHDGTMIYSGYLSDFVCNGEELDRIYLAETIRRDWKKRETDEKGTGQFVNYPGEPIVIPGELFAIPYKDIKNLNVRFISIDNSLEDIQELPDDTSSVQDANQ